jgi:hypothetical protein
VIRWACNLWEQSLLLIFRAVLGSGALTLIIAVEVTSKDKMELQLAGINQEAIGMLTMGRVIEIVLIAGETNFQKKIHMVMKGV